MSGFYRPTGLIVPAHVGAVEGGLRAFAAHLVEAPAFAVSFVSPLLDVPAGVVVSAALALIVNDPAVSKQGTVILVRSRKLTKSKIVHQHSDRIRRILWAARHINDVDSR